MTRAAGPSTAKSISIRPLQSDDLGPYRRFCDELFGRDAYQGRTTYLDWLYEDNPVGRGLDDCLIATEPSGAIVGCIHRLRLPWQIEGRVAVIPSLHNLMIAEAFRGGAGFFLLTRAVKGESHALIPGVTGPLAQAYVRMGYQRLDTRWYRRVVRTDRAVAQTLLHRLGRSRPGHLRSERITGSTSGLVVTASPDDVTAAEVALQRSTKTRGAASTLPMSTGLPSSCSGAFSPREAPGTSSLGTSSMGRSRSSR